MVLAVGAVLATGGMESRGQSTGMNAAQGPSTSSNAAPSTGGVELAPSQLNAIKIEPVGTYLFPVEIEAVG